MKHDLAIAKAEQRKSSSNSIRLHSLACLTPRSFWCLVTTIVSVILVGNKRKRLSVQGGGLFHKMIGGGSGRPTKDKNETKGVSQNI